MAASTTRVLADTGEENGPDFGPSKRRTPTTLERVSVNGQLIEHTDAATKLDLPVLETPQAVSVVPRELLDEQRDLRLGEALRNVAGVSQASNFGFFDGFNIRGFNASAGATYLDGLLASNDQATYELSGLERVEVIKGPASGLYGAGPLSGLVNLVSKRPQAERFADVGVSVGSDRFREARIDANSPLDTDGNVLGRLNLLYRDQDFFVKSSDASRVYAAPSLTWKIDPATTLTLLGTYQRDLIHPWSPTTAYGTVLPDPYGKIPIDLSVNDREYPAVQHRTYKIGGYQFDHRFDETFSLHQGARYEDFHNTWDHWLFFGAIHPDLRTVDRSYFGPYDQHGHDLRVDTNLSASFDTGQVDHYALLGFDYGTRSAGATNNYDPGPYPLDIFDPVYGTVPEPRLLAPAYTRLTSQQHGIYAQDHARFGALTATVGGRWDHAVTRSNGNGSTDAAFSPHAGLTYALTPSVALYANYAKSFNPQSTYNLRFDGGALAPERGKDYEAGIKVSHPDGSLSGMATVFQLTRQNVATSDPFHPNFYLVTGEQRSHGLELETAWRPNAAYAFTGAYAYTRAKVTRDSVQPAGTPLSGIPRHNLNLWNRYTIPRGILQGLGFGLGLNYQSSRPGSSFIRVDPVYHQQITFKSYVLTDAALYYSRDAWDIQLNVRNVFDRRYFTDGFYARITPGQPRSTMLTLQRHF